ncbi:uncharacterized protein ASCRUDRAFT_77925 [Ascoidea rubescens DSM 1968]|uniref:HotDog ACOT-type domain-containing protein n=1 Tax=Ascoidea rubescens DSM 1968 TaxID=1344418 RepID=A0A1D2VA66_9ASCO|nr:hypothetical protein ASCRUDRAFT_77925 [Ascoidea rubescens DSM 1968]ODV58455.1 hypothetical protein ASCRUDRAFT_77925 [Ascoidea rubescens DSM 1968]
MLARNLKIPINVLYKTRQPILRFFSVDHSDSQFLNRASENVDATNTILSDIIDAQRRINTLPKRATWLEALNERKRQLAKGKILDSFSYKTAGSFKISEKTRKDSFSYLVLPFKDDSYLCDAYINAFGRLRVGQLFQDLDALSGRIAYKHCSPAEPMIVTASVDRIYMTKRIDEISKTNVVLAGYVTWVGRSSMEITIKALDHKAALELNGEITEDMIKEDDVILTANFTFVARNPETHKSFAVNHFLPLTPEEWVDFRRAESHNSEKKLRAATANLNKTIPTPKESSLIHKLWSVSKELEKEYDSGSIDIHGNKEKKIGNIKFMRDTKVGSTLFMQPQYRNRHSYMIFGGYLLRQTFELAYCCAAAFAHAPPRFISLDSTTFKTPVPVGSVLYMNSAVCYTEHIHESDLASQESGGGVGVGGASEAGKTDDEVINKELKHLDLVSANVLTTDPTDFLSRPGTVIQVKVDTTVRGLGDSEKTQSGSFIYSFFVPRDSEENKAGVPGYCTVIPQTYSEMMEFIEGRRRAEDTAKYACQLKSDHSKGN